jgi:hypothetical protein
MSIEVRTKATVEEGVVARQELEGRLFITYDPGNGSRYLLLFTSLTGLDERNLDLIGVGPKCWLVTLLNYDPRPSALISDNGQHLNWTYVREKMGRNERGHHVLGEPDAIVVTELIGHLTGRSYVTSEEILKVVAEEEGRRKRIPTSREIDEEEQSST